MVPDGGNPSKSYFGGSFYRLTLPLIRDTSAYDKNRGEITPIIAFLLPGQFSIIEVGHRRRMDSKLFVHKLP